MMAETSGRGVLARLKDAGAALATTTQSRLSDDTVRLAVTGLSRSGKTVFITSLIHNLLSLARGHGKSLPPTSRSGNRGARGLGRRNPAAAEAIARFPYAENLAGMAADDPRWPPRTADIAQISLKLVMRRAMSGISKVLRDREVTLEILDYPGEWLIDLPLLDSSYAQWSREVLGATSVGSRSDLARPFLEFLQGIDADAPADDATAYRAHALYKEYLEACRDRQGLRFLQPGRFLCPGPWGDLPLLWFAPLHGALDKPKPGSLAALMNSRFEAYKSDVKAKFFEPHFQRFDRQIVLVDVLGALNAGQDSFEDTHRAIGDIALAFEHGGGSLLSRAFGKKIDRVYFASTKSDHVPEGKRDALQLLLRHLAGNAWDGISSKRSKLGFGSIASVRCTVDDIASVEGQSVAVVKGLVMGSDVPKKLFPGDIPIKPPSSEFWANALFTMPAFQPPKLDPGGTAGIPHIDLDVALAFLVGDKL
ncbi:MAG: YcjX family protein [Pseudomonadota bacterium]